MTRPHTDDAELSGRQAAALAVAAALAGERFAGATLRGLRESGRLAGREAGLAMELSHGALRHVVTIEAVLGALAHVNRDELSPTLRAILYTAAYQVIWADRIPPFAAVDEAVALAHRLTRGRKPGLVNAVLRRLTGGIAERRAAWAAGDSQCVRVNWTQGCRFATPVLPEAAAGDGGVAHLAAATGTRAARYADLVSRFGPDGAAEIAWASQALPAIVLQRNARRVSPAEFRARTAELGADADSCGDDEAFLPPGANVLDTPAFRAGDLFVQDTTARRAAEALRAQPGERILDLCAAPGGKSMALGLALADQGEVVACDDDEQRLALIAENVARLGLTCVRLRAVPESPTPAALEGETFDAALVDVPCSNTGVIARRPEARLGLTRTKLRSLVGVQERLLRVAAGVVRPGGRLVYSTCSLEPDENEEVVGLFLDERREWTLAEQVTTLPHWGARWCEWRDGGYHARLVRA